MIKVIKIGGAIIDEPERLEHFLEEFAAVKGPKILVHGGGRSASEMSKALGLEPKMVDGRRVTDASTLKVACMMYAGLLNKQIVASLQKMGVNALGLSGADANLIPAVKRNPLPVDYGWVGDVVPEQLSAEPLKSFMNAGFVPVICALTHDQKGHMLNTNADTVAMAMAIMASKIEKTSLLFAFEKKGVLRDVNDEESYIKELSLGEADKLILSGKIHSGMRPKLDAAAGALANGCTEVRIIQAEHLAGILADPDHLPNTKVIQDG